MKKINKLSIIMMFGVFLILMYFKFDGYGFVKYEILGYRTELPSEIHTYFDTLDKRIGEEDRTEFKNMKESDIYLFMARSIVEPWEKVPEQLETTTERKEPGMDMKQVLFRLGLKSTDSEYDTDLIQLSNIKFKYSPDSVAVSDIIYKAYHRYLNNKDTRLMDEIEKCNNRYILNTRSDMITELIIISIIQFIILLLLYLHSDRITLKSYSVLFFTTGLLWDIAAVLFVICMIDTRTFHLLHDKFSHWLHNDYTLYPGWIYIYAYGAILAVCIICSLYNRRRKHMPLKTEQGTAVNDPEQ